MLRNWSGAEKDALLKFAPSYFKYMNRTSQKPSVLAKIFGFYTLKRKNLLTGEVKRMDVLVMENLFTVKRLRENST